MFPLFFYALFKPIDKNFKGYESKCSLFFNILENSPFTAIFIKICGYPESFENEPKNPNPTFSPAKSSPISANKESPGFLLKKKSFQIKLRGLGSDSSPANESSNHSRNKKKMNKIYNFFSSYRNFTREIFPEVTSKKKKYYNK